jgi:two-component system chemotaxis response regulator CheY
MVKRVMIVDDSKFMRIVLKDIINAIPGFEVVAEVDDGGKAIEAYKKNRPDIVTMDIVMPTSGIEAIKQIKAFDPNAKVVMITAMGEEKMLMQEAVAAGASGKYITKPFKQEEVREVLNNI